MDEQVIRAMARWPNVPAVYGWLRLDRRGTWHLVDRNAPGFDETRDGAGSPITSPPIVDFIARNYTHDDAGQWFWQNGPQRVYADVDAAPLVLRVLGQGEAVRFVTHTGEQVEQVSAGWMGPEGEILLATDLGPAVIHDMDLGALSIDGDNDRPVIRAGATRVTLLPTSDPARSLGFVARPRP